MSKETRKVNVIYEELRNRVFYPLLLYFPKFYFEHLLEQEETTPPPIKTKKRENNYRHRNTRISFGKCF